MPLTKDQILGYTKDAKSDNDIYVAAQKYGFSADDYDNALGRSVGTSQKWLDEQGLTLGSQPQRVSLSAPPKIQPVTGSVTADQTAFGQLNTNLAKGSPYIKQAENYGIRRANERGMINSSIAAGAARGEAYKAAAPLAVNDANTYSQQAIQNQKFQNDALNLDAQILADVNKTNATLTQSDIENRRNVAQSNVESIRSNETSRLNQLASNENAINLEKMSAESRERAEALRLKAEVEMNDRSTKANAFQNMTAQIQSIESNPDLTPAQKSEGIARATAYFEQFIAYQDALLGRAA